MKKIIIIVILLFAMLQIVNAQIITTIAGDSVVGYNGDGILAINAELNGPYDVAVDVNGNLYIADFNNSRIRKVTISTGMISTIVGTGTAGYNGDGILAINAELNHPRSIILDSSGNIYISDVVNRRIRKITISTGLISTLAGTGVAGYNGDGILADTAQLNYPNAIALDASGNIYIADKLSERIRKIDVSTGLISTIAGTGTAGYNGDGISAITAQLALPSGIAVDSSGNVYISDNASRIRKITISTGLISTIAGNGISGYNGDGVATSSEINYPSELSVDNSGNIYISDVGNNRIRKLNVSTGMLSTIAGTGVYNYNGDGILAINANIGCTGVTIDTANNVYIADAGNSRIRKINMNTGISDISYSYNSVKVYPNPSSNNITFRLSSFTQNETLLITDIFGRVVYKENIRANDTQVAVSNWKSGVYFYSLTQGEGAAIRGKFIKE